MNTRTFVTLCATVVFVAVGYSFAARVVQGNDQRSTSRPAHDVQCTAHNTMALPAGAVNGMQSGYNYWNNEANFRALNRYQNPVAWTGQMCDLVVDYQSPSQVSCIYDFLHCYSVFSGFYAEYRRWEDLNVAHVVWNSDEYADNLPPIEGLAWNNVVGRHELGHDNYLADHDTSYTGLMCHANTCTRKATGTAAELDSAATYRAAKPVPANSIVVQAISATSITVQFSGHSNLTSLVPASSTNRASWSEKPAIPTGSTSYTFTGLTPNTTYYLRMISRKSGETDGSSQWVESTTDAIARPSNFTVNANGSTTLTLGWSSVPGAASYEWCYSDNPNNPPASWTCTGTTSLSATPSIPSTTSKVVRYYAVRAVSGTGVRSKFSNRGSVSRINETVGGNTYRSYHTLYKGSTGVKMVNARNKLTSGTHYLGYNNGNGADNKYGAVAAGNNWFISPSSWNVPDQPSAFGPTVLAFDAINSTLFVQDSITHSTVCMVIELYCQ